MLRWPLLLTLLSAFATMSPSWAAPKAPVNVVLGMGEGQEGEELPQPKAVAQSPPEANNAVKIQFRGTSQCIGNENGDDWMDLNTSCNGNRIPTFQYTYDKQLRDIHTGMCLDTSDRLYSNRKAYPTLASCSQRSSQQFFLVRVRGSSTDYHIIGNVQGRWMFAGADHSGDLVLENYYPCHSCHRFTGYGGSLGTFF